MRIVAGTLGGRRIDAPDSTETRPTSDRVREAVFSVLDSVGVLDGACVLDAFAGTGALAFESLSRGAASATLVEKSPRALRVLRSNAASLGVADALTVIPLDIFKFAHRTTPGPEPFSLLFLDPPYKLDKFKVKGLIDQLAGSGMLACAAVVVWEHSSNDVPEWPEGFDVVRTKRYGDTTVTIARRTESGEG